MKQQHKVWRLRVRGIKTPSVAQIMKAEPLLDEETAEEIRQLILDGQNVQAIREFDRAVTNFGVEVIKDRHGEEVVILSNPGDQDYPTLMYDRERKCFCAASYSDLMDAQRRRFEQPE